MCCKCLSGVATHSQSHKIMAYASGYYAGDTRRAQLERRRSNYQYMNYNQNADLGTPASPTRQSQAFKEVYKCFPSSRPDEGVNRFDNDPGLRFVDITIKKFTVRALIDTSLRNNRISKRFVVNAQIGLPFKQQKRSVGNGFRSLGVVTCKFLLKNGLYRDEFQVMEGPEDSNMGPVYLGCPFFRYFNTKFDFAREKVILQLNNVEIAMLRWNDQSVDEPSERMIRRTSFDIKEGMDATFSSKEEMNLDLTERIFLNVELNGKPIRNALVDTGSLKTTISEEAAKKCDLSGKITKGASGRGIGVIYDCPVYVGTPGIEFVMPVVVESGKGREMRFGMDFLKAFGCKVDLMVGRMSYNVCSKCTSLAEDQGMSEEFMRDAMARRKAADEEHAKAKKDAEEEKAASDDEED